MDEALVRIDQALESIDPSDETTLRRLKAWKLRLHGYSHEDIADALEVGIATAYRDIRWCIDNLPPAFESAEDFRRISLKRLEQQVTRLITRLQSGASENPDVTERVLIAVQDTQAKLLGAYAPSRIDSSVTVKTELVGIPLDQV